MQDSTVHYLAVQCSAVQCSAVQCSSAVQQQRRTVHCSDIYSDMPLIVKVQVAPKAENWLEEERRCEEVTAIWISAGV